MGNNRSPAALDVISSNLKAISISSMSQQGQLLLERRSINLGVYRPPSILRMLMTGKVFAQRHSAAVKSITVQSGVKTFC